jgi:hypothetical protein
MNPDLDNSVYSIPSSIYPFPSVAEVPSTVLQWHGDHHEDTRVGYPLLPRGDKLPRYRTLTENELAEGDDGVARAGRKPPGAAGRQPSSSGLRAAQSMPTLASNRGKRKNDDTQSSHDVESSEKDAGVMLGRTISGADNKAGVIPSSRGDSASQPLLSHQSSRAKPKLVSRHGTSDKGSREKATVAHQTHAEGLLRCRCQCSHTLLSSLDAW